MPRKLSEHVKGEIEERRKIFQISVKENEIINFEELFGNDHPVHLEIGSGRGEFLVSQSLLEWKHNFVGVEVDSARLGLILRLLDEEKHSNVKVLDLFIDSKTVGHFPENSLKKIHIIQPDPWPKRKHNNRRLINHKFLDMLHKLLQERGMLEIQTDHEDYGKWILKHLNEREDFVPVYGGVSRIPRHGHIVTYFEEKKMREGFKPMYITYRKKKTSDLQFIERR